MAGRLRLAASIAVAGGLLLVGGARPVLGHALKESYTLPVPLGLYLWGALGAVAASFLAVLIAGPVLAPTPTGWPLPPWLRRAGSAFGRVLGLVLWFGAMLAGMFGLVHEFLPATLFWVLVWAGIPIVAAVIGNPWPTLSPFRALLDGATRLVGSQPDLGLAYPSGLARWPAVGLLLIGLIIELTVLGSGAGAFVGWLLLAYTVVTGLGMLAFGPVTWLRNAEVFEVLFGWFGRIGPIGRRSLARALCRDCASDCVPGACVDCPECVVVGTDRELALEVRRPLGGLADVRGAGWSDAAFILLALAGVTFDGLQDTALWVVLNTAVEGALAVALPAEVILVISGPLGLVCVWAGFLAAFAVAATVTRAIAGAPIGLSSTAGRYAATLLPIAAGYVVAHYLTVVLQGIVTLPGMLLQPGAIEVVLDWLPAGFVWYLSVGAIVAGHVAAVLLAHREALRLKARHLALAELPLVALMLGYTVLSLWIIAQPITVAGR